jgi:hypothetical protein
MHKNKKWLEPNNQDLGGSWFMKKTGRQKSGVRVPLITCRDLAAAISTHLQCGICLDIPVKAVITSPCQHIFCFCCLKS